MVPLVVGCLVPDQGPSFHHILSGPQALSVQSVVPLFFRLVWACVLSRFSYVLLFLQPHGL